MKISLTQEMPLRRGKHQGELEKYLPPETAVFEDHEEFFEWLRSQLGLYLVHWNIVLKNQVLIELFTLDGKPSLSLRMDAVNHHNRRRLRRLVRAEEFTFDKNVKSWLKLQ